MKNSVVTTLLAKTFIALLFSTVFSACGKPSTADEPASVQTPLPLPSPYANVEFCGVKDPANNIHWLKNIINSTSPRMLHGARVYGYLYKGASVIYVKNLASSIFPMQVYNCNGTISIGHLTSPGADWTAWWTFLDNERTGEILLWKKD